MSSHAIAPARGSHSPERSFFQGWFDRERATFQQYAIVPAEITAKVRMTLHHAHFAVSEFVLSRTSTKIPDNISFDQAASIPLGLATVFTGIWNHDPKAKSVGFPAPWEEGGLTKFAGKPAFIIGGSSSVGQYGTSSTHICAL